MRATWITSLSFGTVLGLASAFLRGIKHPLAAITLLCLLAACFFFGAIGVAQIRQSRAERRAFGPTASMRHQRHVRLPIPGFGRVVILCVSAVLSEVFAGHFLR